MSRWFSLLCLVCVGVYGCQDGLDLGIGGCSGGPGASVPFRSTPTNTVPASVETAVTAAGTEFLVERRELLAGLLLDVDADGWVYFDLPEFNFGASNGLGIGLRDVRVGFDLRAANVELSFLPDPTRIRMGVEHARLQLDGGEVWIAVGGDAACALGNGLEVGTPREALLDASFEVDISLVVDEQGRFQSQVEVLPFEVHGLDFELIYDPDIPECDDGVTSAECRVVCTASDAGVELFEALYEVFEAQVHELAQPVIERLVNSIVADLTDQPLFVEGSLHPRILSALLPTAADAHAIGFKLAPTPNGFQLRTAGAGGDGIALTTDVGFDTIDHPCVPAANALTPLPAGTPPVLTGYDHGGTPYHLGISLSDAVVNQALWTAYRAGTLCLALDSSQVEALFGQTLSTDSLSLVLPGLRELSQGPRPLLIAVDPQFEARDFPLARFSPVADDGGIPQAAIALSLPRLGLSFYALIESRWVRLFGGELDVALDVVLQATPDNRLTLAISPPQIGALRETYNELLEGANIEALVNMLVDLAASAVFGDDINFEVPLTGLISQATGLPLDAEIAGLRTEGEGGHFLSILTTLVPALAAAAPAAQTVAEVQDFDAATGSLALTVASPGAEDALFQWQIDAGPWRPLRAPVMGTLRVEEPRLRVLGAHTVAVRAVRRGDYRSLDLTPALLSVETHQPVAEPTRAHPPAPAIDAGGCSASGRSQGAWPWALLMALGLVRRRRLAGLLCLLAALGGCDEKKAATEARCELTEDCPGGLSCFDGVCTRPNPCDTSEDCCPGEVCNGGSCDADPGIGCAIDDDCFGDARHCADGLCIRISCVPGGCPDDHRCVGGYCHRDPPCRGRCTDTQACYPHLDLCRKAPESCNQSCPSGSVRVVQDPEGVTGPLCDLSLATCECAAVPALQPADYGRFASMGVVEDEVFFAAWDADFGDLVFVEGVEGGPLKVTYLDGVPPDAPVVADAAGPRGGKTAPGPDRGRHTSLAFDRKARPHIAYYDAEQASLRYIRRSAEGQWTAPFVVDSAGDVGRFAVLLIDSAGWPHIIYHARTTDGRAGLKYAFARTSEPTGADFTVRELSMRPTDAPPSMLGVLPEVHGVQPCATAGVDGKLHVAFYDGEERWAYRAVGGPDGFSVSRLNGFKSAVFPPDPGGRYDDIDSHDLGQDCAIAYASNGEEYLAFSDRTTGALLSFHGPADAIGLFELVDGGRPGQRRFVGADPVLRLTEDERAVVVYQDGTDNDLMISVRNGELWSSSPSAIASAGALGFYNGMEVVNGGLVVGTLQLRTTAEGRGAHSLHVYRVSVPNF